MDKFILESNETKEAFFQKASEQTKLPDYMIEKDFWICWTLKALFSIDAVKDHLTFKGGTSLSKIYHVIERFSEDIDLSLEKTIFNLDDASDPEKASSNTKRKKLIEELGIKCKNFVKTELKIALESHFSQIIPDSQEWTLQIDSTDPDEQSLIFTYPTVLNG